jgi:hypothetical protein
LDVVAKRLIRNKELLGEEGLYKVGRVSREIKYAAIRVDRAHRKAQRIINKEAKRK